MLAVLTLSHGGNAVRPQKRCNLPTGASTYLVTYLPIYVYTTGRHAKAVVQLRHLHRKSATS